MDEFSSILIFTSKWKDLTCSRNRPKAFCQIIDEASEPKISVDRLLSIIIPVL